MKHGGRLWCISCLNACIKRIERWSINSSVEMGNHLNIHNNVMSKWSGGWHNVVSFLNMTNKSYKVTFSQPEPLFFCHIMKEFYEQKLWFLCRFDTFHEANHRWVQLFWLFWDTWLPNLQKIFQKRLSIRGENRPGPQRLWLFSSSSASPHIQTPSDLNTCMNQQDWQHIHQLAPTYGSLSLTSLSTSQVPGLPNHHVESKTNHLKNQEALRQDVSSHNQQSRLAAASESRVCFENNEDHRVFLPELQNICRSS